MKRSEVEGLGAARPRAGGEVVTDDVGVRYESVFRERWRDRQSAGARPGELIKNPGWIDAGLVALAVLLAAGAVAVGTITVGQIATLPAVVQGMTVTADRGGGPAPAQGTAVQFRDTSGQRLARSSSTSPLPQ